MVQKMQKIATENLSKVFGPRPGRALELLAAGGSKAEAQERFGLAIGVHDVSLSVNEGETFVLMGLSGSGKSTLLRCLNRLHEPSAGRVLVDGVDITRLGRRELLEIRRGKFSGMVFQNFAILPQRTVADNVAYGLEVQGVGSRERRERAGRAIDLVGLAGWEANYPAELSGGMQQRVGLARALAVEADILLMDEAFSALDPLIRRELQDELLELQARVNKTIVFVTHDLDEALRLGDRIAIMRDGGLVQVGTAEEIVSEPADDYVTAFVEGIDRSEILTARRIMQRPTATAHVRDGLRTALTKLRLHGLSGLFVTDSDRVVRGYLSGEAAVERLRAEGEGGPATAGQLAAEATTVAEDAVLSGIVDLASRAATPIGVVDERNRLRGVIVKGAILAALAGRPAEGAAPAGQA